MLFRSGPEEHIPEYVDAEIEDYEMPAADQLPAPAKDVYKRQVQKRSGRW